MATSFSSGEQVFHANDGTLHLHQVVGHVEGIGPGRTKQVTIILKSERVVQKKLLDGSLPYAWIQVRYSRS